MPDLTRIFAERGDLAHLALFLWAASASALLIFVLREYAAAMRRFDDFVRELSRFNRKFGGRLMDSLHSVMRSLRPAPKRKNDRKRDHLTVFREFLSHLDRVSKQHAARDVKAVRKARGTGRPKG